MRARGESYNTTYDRASVTFLLRLSSTMLMPREAAEKLVFLRRHLERRSAYTVQGLISLDVFLLYELV